MLRGPTFKLLGIPVRVEIWFFVATLLLGLDRIRYRDKPLFWLAEWFVVVAVSILVHELGHAFAYRRYGQRASIVLWGLGGLTFGQQVLPPRKRIVVSLAGPFAEILLLGIPAQIALTAMGTSGFVRNPDLYSFLSDVAWLNIAWALVNLLPLLPLDGGNVCDAVLEIRHDEPRRQTTRMISIVTGFLFGVFALVYWGSTFGLVFGWILAVVNLFQYLQVRNGGQMGGTQFQLYPEAPDTDDDRANVVSMDSARKKRDRRSPTELVASGYSLLEHRDYKGARRVADRLQGKRLSGTVALDATEVAAWAWLGERNPVQAHQVLEARPKGARISAPLTAVLALADKQTDVAVQTMVQSLVRDPDGPAKLIGVDLFAEYGHIHRLARELVDLPGGTGFEAAVALEGLLHRLNRTQDASTVSDVIMLG